MSEATNSEIKFNISLDENQVPLKIDWEAAGAGERSECKAMMISLWDKKEENTMRIDLWTKEMLVDEMKQFFHQSMLTMADTLQRATGEDAIAEEMREFSQQMGVKMGIVKETE